MQTFLVIKGVDAKGPQIQPYVDVVLVEPSRHDQRIVVPDDRGGFRFGDDANALASGSIHTSAAGKRMGCRDTPKRLPLALSKRTSL